MSEQETPQSPPNKGNPKYSARNPDRWPKYPPTNIRKTYTEEDHAELKKVMLSLANGGRGV